MKPNRKAPSALFHKKIELESNYSDGPCRFFLKVQGDVLFTFQKEHVQACFYNLGLCNCVKQLNQPIT